jgi:MFS family permease
VGLVTAASYIGAALAFVVTPYIISQQSWEMAFTLFGASALVWLPFWILNPLPPPMLPELTDSSSDEGTIDTPLEETASQFPLPTTVSL